MFLDNEKRLNCGNVAEITARLWLFIELFGLRCHIVAII